MSGCYSRARSSLDIRRLNPIDPLAWGMLTIGRCVRINNSAANKCANKWSANCSWLACRQHTTSIEQTRSRYASVQQCNLSMDYYTRPLAPRLQCTCLRRVITPVRMGSRSTMRWQPPSGWVRSLKQGTSNIRVKSIAFHNSFFY